MKVGLMAFSGAMEKTTAAEYARLISIAKRADSLSLEAIWLPERHLTRFGEPYPNPMLLLAALASCTSRISLRAGSSVAPLHDAIALAENLSVLDNLARGRIGVAFASGWHPNDFIYRPENFSSRREVLIKSVTEILKLWRGHSIMRMNGVGEECEIRLSPPPYTKDRLPVFITAAGSPEIFEQAGRIGAGILTHVLGGDLIKLAAYISRYRQAHREAGHDPTDARVVLMLHTYLASTTEEANARATVPFRDYLMSIAPLGKSLADSRSHSIDFGKMTDSQARRIADLQYKRLTQGRAMIGTVEAAAETARSMASIGVDEIACLIDFGIVGSLVEAQLNLLGDLAEALD